MSNPLDVVRPLMRVRQIREFTGEPVADDALEAITEAARWSGSGQNKQPARYIVIRETETIRKIAESGLPQTRSLNTAMAAVAITMPDDAQMTTGRAYDEARAAERMLIAASLIGLGAGIAWVRPDVRDIVRELLRYPPDRFVRTIISIGHPTEAARRPKAAPGTARLPRSEVVFDETWPVE